MFSITIGTFERRRLFKDSLIAGQIVSTLNSGPISKQTDIFAYCLMPEHFHILISVKNGNLIDIIGGWKRFTGNLLRKTGLKGPFWQRGFYDHALRKDEDIVKTAKRTGALVAGPIPLPTKIERYTVNRSPHVNKKSMEQFETRIHKRLLDILEPTAKTVDELKKLSRSETNEEQQQL